MSGVTWSAATRPRPAADRAAVLDGLERQLKRGDKALIGSSLQIGRAPWTQR